MFFNNINQKDNIRISTVFLGIDHNFNGGPPLIFETMAFDDEVGFADLECERYSTWDEAEVGHKAMVDKIRPVIEGPVEDLPLYLSDDMSHWLKDILLERLSKG
jgi:hypothetical protein